MLQILQQKIDFQWIEKKILIFYGSNERVKPKFSLNKHLLERILSMPKTMSSTWMLLHRNDNDRNATESKCINVLWKEASLNTLLSSSMYSILSLLKCMRTMNFSFKFLFVPSDRPIDWLCSYYRIYSNTYIEIESFAVHISSNPEKNDLNHFNRTS